MTLEDSPNDILLPPRGTNDPRRIDGKNVVVVLPTYNERENLAAIVEQLFRTLPAAHVVVVDDNSPDGTGAIGDEIADARQGRMHVLHRPKKTGLGAAYSFAFGYVLERFPDAEFVVQMDADFSHDPRYVPALVEACGDADLVLGSRYVHGISVVDWPLSRLVVSRMGTVYARLTTGLPVTDCTSGFKCWRAGALRAVNVMDIRANGYVYQIETTFRAWRNGFRLKDFAFIFFERRRGKSKLHLDIAFEAFLVVLRLGFERLFRTTKHPVAVPATKPK